MRPEYITCLICLLTLLSIVKAKPSSYLSSMTGGDGGMTWMGWAPQTGMTAFASSSNPWNYDKGWKNTGVELEPPPPQDTSSAQEDEHDQPERPPKKWNKPRYDDDERPGSSSKAEASLNAWFPIMLGLFPNQDEKRNEQDQQYDNVRSITALANSVNHGSRGVASSHAVAYGGQPPNYRSKTWNKNLGVDKNATPSVHSEQKPQQFYRPMQRYAKSSY